jgi:hypothetical protein
MITKPICCCLPAQDRISCFRECAHWNGKTHCDLNHRWIECSRIEEQIDREASMHRMFPSLWRAPCGLATGSYLLGVPAVRSPLVAAGRVCPQSSARVYAVLSAKHLNASFNLFLSQVSYTVEKLRKIPHFLVLHQYVHANAIIIYLNGGVKFPTRSLLVTTPSSRFTLNTLCSWCSKLNCGPAKRVAGHYVALPSVDVTTSCSLSVTVRRFTFAYSRTWH